MTLIKRLLQWYADRSEIDLACGGTLHKNTPMLKEAADALEARDRRIAELERHVDVLRDDLSITQATLESKKTLLAACESQLAAATKRIAELEAELERERMRLAACGSAALGYFDGCKDEYKSASLDDVLRLREKLAAIEAAKNADTKHEEFKKNLAENARMSNELGYAFLQQEKSAEPVGLVDFTEFRGAVLLDGAKERVKDGDLLYTTPQPVPEKNAEPVAWRCSSPPCKCDQSNYRQCCYANYTTPQPAVPEGMVRSLTDELMDCVDRLGGEADSVDPRVWEHLMVYAPQPVVPEGMVLTKVANLIACRDALVDKDENEAYHQLYTSFDWGDPYKPWAEWEFMLAAAPKGEKL